MSAQKLDGATAMMISADPAVLFALRCDGGEAPAPSAKPSLAWLPPASLLNLKKNVALLTHTQSETSS